MKQSIRYVILLSIVILLAACAGQVYQIASVSMEPTYGDGKYVTIAPVELAELQRGDIIGYRHPSNPDEFFVKRLIGLSGETVEIREGAIYINGDLLEEPYPVTTGSPSETFGPIELREDEYFVLGDNRPNSADSRQYGAVSGQEIIGRISVTAWNRFLNRLEQN